MPEKSNPTHAAWTELSLAVKDMGRSVIFYQEALGLEVKERGNGWVILVEPRTKQQICLKQCQPHPQPAISLHCDDFGKALEHLVHSGAQVGAMHGEADFRYGSVTDPDGHEIFLWWEDGNPPKLD